MRNRRRSRRAALGAQSTGTPAGAAPTSTDVMGNRFQMKQRLFTIRDRFWIKDQNGRNAFSVTSKLIRVRDTLVFADARGQELYQVQQKLLRIRDTMEIETPSGQTAAKVHNALITPLRDRWQVNIPGGPDLTTQGNILNHEYKIKRGRQTIAEVSKRWFRVRDTYGVDVANGEDAALIMAITVVVDMMAHSGR